MGRMECYKTDTYHVGKHSRRTPRVSPRYFLFIYFHTFDLLSDRLTFVRRRRIFTNTCYISLWDYPTRDL